MAFSSEWLSGLLSKSDIADIISSYIELKPKGRKLWGLCPFHGEKTPSFSVSPDKQLFYCFGCHVGGSVVQFVMQIEKLSYPEAIRFLANRAHVTMPDEQSDEDYLRKKAYRERLLAVNQASARFFCESFINSSSDIARQYAIKRGITKETILRFGIGYAPDSWDSLKRHLSEKGFSEQEMLDAGVLVRNTSKNTVYDTYRNRIIFPIQNISGGVIGFGGRVLDDSKPKYINTGDTLLYNKKNNLYGLNLIRQDKLSDIIIVEGYMDVVGLYRFGISNAVASLGTALTVQQARLLKRFTSNIYIAYDGDFAGQNGMIRGLEILMEQGLSVHVICFPDDLDPDEFVAEYGRDAFQTLKENALTVSAFKLERMSDKYDFAIEEQRETYAAEACKYISSLEPVSRERYFRIVSEKTGFNLDVLHAQTKGTESNKQTTTGFSAHSEILHDNASVLSTNPAEREMIRSAIQSKNARKWLVDNDAEQLISSPVLLRLFKYIAHNGDDIIPYISTLPSEEAKQISRLLELNDPMVDPEKCAVDCFEILKTEALEKQLELLQRQLNSSSSVPNRDLLNQIKDLSLQIQKRGRNHYGRN